MGRLCRSGSICTANTRIWQDVDSVAPGYAWETSMMPARSAVRFTAMALLLLVGAQAAIVRASAVIDIPTVLGGGLQVFDTVTDKVTTSILSGPHRYADLAGVAAELRDQGRDAVV
jgi:hypothetical protein